MKLGEITVFFALTAIVLSKNHNQADYEYIPKVSSVRTARLLLHFDPMYLRMDQVKFVEESLQKNCNTQKVSVFGFFLVRIFFDSE